MSIDLVRCDLLNMQQMEVGVNGPDGATHLILCTGVANLGTVTHETYTFLVGPRLSQRQFVSTIASAAISTIQQSNLHGMEGTMVTALSADLISVEAAYDEAAMQVKVSTEVQSTLLSTKLCISYSVSILAELPVF